MELGWRSKLSRDKSGVGVKIRKTVRVGGQARSTPAHCPPGRP